MQNNEYNSLTEKLIQSGILQKGEDIEVPFEGNFFNAKNLNISKNQIKNINRKRINNYDLELLENSKYYFQDENESKFQKIIYKFFPKLYEIKIAKDVIKKMNEMGIDTKSLFSKTIPYGEGEIRYGNLVKFIKYANEIQSKLKRKTKK